MRTHKEQIEKDYESRCLTLEQIRRAKQERCKRRNAQRRQDRREVAEARVAEWRKLSPQEQLKALPAGGAKKQRARILAKMKAHAA